MARGRFEQIPAPELGYLNPDRSVTGLRSARRAHRVLGGNARQVLTYIARGEVMHTSTDRMLRFALVVGTLAVAILSSRGHVVGASGAPQTAATQRIDLAERLAARKLRTVNREVTTVQGTPAGVHLSEKADNGIAWIEGTDFAEGTIEVDIRGRDLQQRSFVGIAFHGKDDRTYECVYLRPFNFRADDPVRHQHAVQYVALPDYDWPRLRQDFPEEFEDPVDPSISPTGWVPLRVVVKGARIQIYVGSGTKPTLEVRKLGQFDRGLIGLWAGNGSDGDFANLRITPSK